VRLEKPQRTTGKDKHIMTRAWTSFFKFRHALQTGTLYS